MLYPQSHSLRCTESFMRENVMGGLQQMKPDEESKARMLDILKRLHEEEETDGFHEEGMLILCGLLYFSIILQINFV